MIPLNRLKKDVQFNTELTQLVDVLKGIAASRYHVLERQLALFEPYAKAAGELLAAVDVRRVVHPFLQPQTATVGAILVTSDAGFLGGLNTQVVTAGLRETGPQGALTVIGERGAGYLEDLRRRYTRFPGIQDTARSELAMTVRDHVVEQVLSGQVGKLVVAYPRPISFAVQQVTIETLLPCTAWLPEGQARGANEMLWESRMADVVEYVVAQRLGHRLDELFALSRLAEMAARAMHLEGSHQELVQRGKRLKAHYFRARHEIIDRSLREIVSAQLLCKSA